MNKSIKILVVDDDAVARGVLIHYLSSYGSCTEAENCAKAVEQIRQAIIDKAPFEVVCLDIMMPKMDGLDTLQAIRQIEKENQIEPANQAKVIMTTTASQVSKTMKAFHYGCNAYLVKPVSKDDLYREMMKLPVSERYKAYWRTL